jgi:hypothetical protein
MFTRNENGRLIFNWLNFEIMIDDVFEAAAPPDIEELEWMVKNMVNSIQKCASEYVEESEMIEDEWEDVFYE